jgi:hypothetical protein
MSTIGAYCDGITRLMMSHRTSRNATESPLLKLPREIRDMIWAEVLGTENIHLDVRLEEDGTSWTNRIYHVTCDTNLKSISAIPQQPLQSEWLIQRSTDLVIRDGFYNDGDVDDAIAAENACTGCCSNAWAKEVSVNNDSSRINPIPLLQTCRQILSEAEPILYQNHTFVVTNSNVLPRFIQSRNVSQLQNIRAIALHFLTHYEQQNWPTMPHRDWQAALSHYHISRLNLNHLHVFISVSDCFALQNPAYNGSDIGYPLPRNLLAVIQRFRLCPLNDVRVDIGLRFGRCPRRDLTWILSRKQRAVAQFPAERRAELGEQIKTMLLDPEGRSKALELMKKDEAQQNEETKKMLKNRKGFWAQKWIKRVGRDVSEGLRASIAQT